MLTTYNEHGNNVASLTRNGTGGFSIGDRRTYDAWGVVRAQQSGGDPKLRYCASLGHQADDSGLVYMRARYYEPASGRFVSEDPERQGLNWFAYCGNNPVSRVDASGKAFTDAVVEALKAIIFNDIMNASSAMQARAILIAACNAVQARLDIQLGEALAERSVIMEQWNAALQDPNLSDDELLARMEGLEGRLNANTGRAEVLKASSAMMKVFFKEMSAFIDMMGGD